MSKSIKDYRKVKVRHARIKGIEMALSHDDIQQLLDNAGITIEQVGKHRGMYQLGRYGDTGGYTIDNCRFITHAENQAEKTFSEESRKKMSESAKNRSDNRGGGRTFSAETRAKMSASHTGKKHTPEHRAAQRASLMRTIEKKRKLLN